MERKFKNEFKVERVISVLLLSRRGRVMAMMGDNNNNNNNNGSGVPPYLL